MAVSRRLVRAVDAKMLVRCIKGALEQFGLRGGGAG